MGKKKKRLQMQTKTDEQVMRQILDLSADLGLFERMGYDDQGEPIYAISEQAEERAEVLRKIIASRPDLQD